MTLTDGHPPERPHVRDQARWWRWPARITLGLLLLLVAGWFILYVTKGRFLRGPFERIIAAQLHRPVRVAGDFQLYFDPFELKLVADGLAIANPAYATRAALLQARHLETRIAPLSLLGP